MGGSCGNPPLPIQQAAVSLFVERKIVGAAVAHRITILAQHPAQLAPVNVAQVLVLDENQRRRIDGEIQRLEDLVVIPLGIDVQQVQVTDSIPAQYIGERADLDIALDDEGFKRGIQVLQDVVPIE